MKAMRAVSKREKLSYEQRTRVVPREYSNVTVDLLRKQHLASSFWDAFITLRVSKNRS